MRRGVSLRPDVEPRDPESHGDCTAALRLGQTEGPARGNVGLTVGELGRYDAVERRCRVSYWTPDTGCWSLVMSRRAKLESLLATSPDDVFLNFGLAMELAKEGLTDPAVAQFDRVIGLDAAYIPAHFQKGATLLSAQRRTEAEAALQRGIETALAHGDPHAADEMRALLHG